MKILVIGGFGYNLTPNILNERGTAGWVLYLIKLTEGLAKLGHEVYQIVQCGKHAGVHNGVTWIEQNDSNTVKKIVKEVDVAINICGWDWLYTNILPDKCKKIFWSHDYRTFNVLKFWNNRDYGSNEKYGRCKDGEQPRQNYIEQFDKIVCNTQAHRDSIAYTLSQPKDKVCYIYPGIDHFEVSDVPRNQFKLIYCANATKGLSNLPYIYKKLRALDSRYSLSIISNISLYGFVDEKPENEAIKTVLSAYGGVTIHPELTRDQLIKEMASSQVYLFPCNYKESFGFTILESVKCGAFCVTTNIGSVSEFTFDGLVKVNMDSDFNNLSGPVIVGNAQLDKFVEEELKPDLTQEDTLDPTVKKELGEMGYFWNRIKTKLITDNVCYACKKKIKLEDSKDVPEVHIVEGTKVELGVIAFVCLCSSCFNKELDKKVDEEVEK